jgi:hemerythrin-like domain-containing protein
MLLSTCALLILRIEQTRQRAAIEHVLDCMAQPSRHAEVDCLELAHRSEQLIWFAESHHQLRLEKALFPALRAASGEAGEPLRTLERLGQSGLDILPRMRSALRSGAARDAHQIFHACALVQAYCGNLLERLACEEHVLLPIAQRVLPSEIWFKVGAEFLEQDAQRSRPLASGC